MTEGHQIFYSLSIFSWLWSYHCLIMILLSFEIISTFRSCPYIWKVKVFVTQSCWTLQLHGPLGSFIHGILQAKIEEWVGISFSWGSSWPRDQTHVSCIAGRFLTIWATRQVRVFMYSYLYVWFAPLFSSWSLELFLIYVQSLLLTSTFMPHFRSTKSEFPRQLPRNLKINKNCLVVLFIYL